MENAADALKIGFAVMVFVIALSVVFSMISQAKQTSDVVFEMEDEEKYFQEGLEGVTYLTSGNTERIVGWETVVPTIYRYNIENYGVTIVNPQKKDTIDYIIARFDVETETIAQNWYNIAESYETTRKNHIKYLNNKVFNTTMQEGDWKKVFESIYNATSTTNNKIKIGAPWLSSNIQDTLNRLKVDLEYNTINDTIKYSSAEYKGLKLAGNYADKKFKEKINTINQTQENGEVKQKVEIIYEVQKRREKNG